MGVNPIPRPRHERQGQGTELGRKASEGGIVFRSKSLTWQDCAACQSSVLP